MRNDNVEFTVVRSKPCVHFLLSFAGSPVCRIFGNDVYRIAARCKAFKNALSAVYLCRMSELTVYEQHIDCFSGRLIGIGFEIIVDDLSLNVACNAFGRRSEEKGFAHF